MGVFIEVKPLELEPGHLCVPTSTAWCVSGLASTTQIELSRLCDCACLRLITKAIQIYARNISFERPETIKKTPI